MPSEPRPSSFPEWATGGSADLTDPPAANKATGWIQLQLPPHDWENWLKNNIYLWLKYLDVKQPQAYDTSQAAIAAMDVGEVGVLDEWDSNSALSTAVFSAVRSATVGFERGITCDGEYLYVAYETDGSDYIECFDRNGNSKWKKLQSVTTIYDIHADGDAVYYVADSTCYKLNRLTGNADGTFTPYNHGAQLDVVFSTGQYVWIAGAVGTGSNTVRNLDPGTGAALNSAAIGNHTSGWMIEARYNHAYLFHTVSSSNNLHYVKADMSVDANATVSNVGNAIVLLNDSLLVHNTGQTWELRDLITLTQIGSNITFPGSGTARDVAFDGKYVYYTESTPEIYILNGTHFGTVNKISGGASVTLVTADTSAYYTVHVNGANDVSIARRRTPKRAHLVKRCNGQDKYRNPFQHLLVPDGQY